jgi:subtilisin family serine protease
MHRLHFRRLSLLALASLLSFAAIAPSASAVEDGEMTRTRSRRFVPAPESFVPGEVVVKFRESAAAAKMAEPLAADLGLVRESRIDGLEIDLFRFAGAGDVLDAVARLRQRPDVVYAEPNYLSYLARIPNDTFYSNVEGYARDLQRWTFGGTDTNGGIRAEAAWDVTTGRPDVTIAVLDSGVYLAHPDLAPNLWTNLDEVAGNGVDDDQNGFVDDVHGWDFYSGDNDPDPDLGNGINDDGVGIGDDNTYHGTFVANMAAGRGNDGRGILGAAWSCRVMALKLFTDDGGASDFNIAAAFKYAADNGADVVNASFSKSSGSATLADGVTYAVARDCVLVAAAGNNDSSTPLYPARYDGVLSVGASGHAFETPDQVDFFGPAAPEGRAGFSQYGATAVDVVAPGILFGSSVASETDAILDPTLHAGDILGFASSGTSFSSPIVAGLAALLVSRDKDLNGGVRTLTNAQIVDIIQSTAVDLADDPSDAPDGGPNWDGHGRVDFAAALAEISGGTGGRSVRLAWQPPSGAVLAAPSNLTATDSGSVTRQGVTEQEPNNSLQSAQTIAFPTTVTGQISTSDEGPVQIVYSNAQSDVVEDLYKMTLGSATSMTIALTPSGDADLDLAIMTDLDGDGTYTFEAEYLRNDEATTARQPEIFNSIELPAGTYYIACTIYDGAPRVQSDGYTLAITSGAADVTGYRVYRATAPNVATTPANRIASLSGSQLTFLDTSAPGGSVYYVVTALYDAAESGPSNEASPGATNPNAPVILDARFKKGKLTIAAAGSKIVAGSTLVVDNAESFPLTLAKNGAKWLVKKNARGVPGDRKIADAIPAGRQVSLVVISPDGARSVPVTFSRN